MIRCLAFAVGLCGLAGAACAQADVYSGLCDASAAITLGGGRFVVAEDENINKLFTYQAGQRQPVSELDLLDYLGNANGDAEPRESDLEAAAQIGSDVYWISSHGTDKDGVAEESRFRFFATPLAEENGSLAVEMPVKPPVKTLRDAMIEDPRLASLDLEAAAAKPPKEDGLSIEGLAATPENALLIGLRSPLKDGKAVLIPLLNPAAVIDGADANFGDPIFIDMSGRGIRSIERVGERYLILGGDPGEGDLDSRHYAWSGAADAPAQDLNADLGGLNGEALFATGEHEVYVLSDDGNRKIDGKKCKNVDIEKREFRGIRVGL